MHEERTDDMDAWKEKVQHDINEIKSVQGRHSDIHDKLKDDIRDLQTSDKLQNLEIDALKSTLTDIKDDTNWIRRRVTGAVITATLTAIIGGLIGIAIMYIYGG